MAVGVGQKRPKMLDHVAKMGAYDDGEIGV
jgi:hypothetical protein